jgi:hypothetical protein
MKKERVLIRFRPEIYECFELEAAYQGLRVGTIANQLLISELNKAASVKPEHCVVFASFSCLTRPSYATMACNAARKQRYYRISAGANRKAGRKADQ